MNYAEIQIL